MNQFFQPTSISECMTLTQIAENYNHKVQKKVLDNLNHVKDLLKVNMLVDTHEPRITQPYYIL